MDSTLKNYEEFLKDRKLARSKHIPYMVMWVRKFLVFSHKYREEPFERVLGRYIDDLAGSPLDGLKEAMQTQDNQSCQPQH